MVTAGAELYPEPALVSEMLTTWPFAIVATAVAVVPAVGGAMVTVGADV
jgi:hypothetical protein